MSMTYRQYQELSLNLRHRAYRLSQVYLEQARDLGQYQLGSGRDLCFLCAHNWQGQAWMTPLKNRAARKILWLQEQSWKPGELVDRILARAWRKVS